MADFCSSALKRERDEINRLQLQIASQFSNNATTTQTTNITTSPPLLKQQQIISQNQSNNSFQLSTQLPSQIIPLSFFPTQTSSLQQQQHPQIPSQFIPSPITPSPTIPPNFLPSPSFDFEEQRKRLLQLQHQQQQFIFEQNNKNNSDNNIIITTTIDQHQQLQQQHSSSSFFPLPSLQNNSFLFPQQNSGHSSFINSSSQQLSPQQPSTIFQLNSSPQFSSGIQSITKNIENSSDFSSLYSLISENTLIPLNQKEKQKNNFFIYPTEKNKEKNKNKKSFSEEIIFIENNDVEKLNNKNKESKRKLKEALIEKVNKGKEENKKEKKLIEQQQNSLLQQQQQLPQLPQQQPSTFSSQNTNSLSSTNKQISELNKEIENTCKRSIPIFQITPQQLHLAMQQYFLEEEEGEEIIVVVDGEEEIKNKNVEIVDFEEEENLDEDNAYVDVVGDGEARSSLPKMQRKAHIEFYRKLKSFRNRAPQLDCQLCDASIPNNDASIRSHIHGHCKTSMFVCKLCQKGFQDQHLVFEHIDREHPAQKGTKYIEDRRDMGLLVEILTQCFPRVFCRARDILFDAIGRLTSLTESKQQTKISCLLCGQIVPTMKSCIYGHLSIHPSYKCKKCRFSSNDEKSQLEHQKREHPDFPSGERCFCISLAFDVLLETLKSCFPIEQNEICGEKNLEEVNTNSSLFLHPGSVLESKKIIKNKKGEEGEGEECLIIEEEEKKGKKRNLIKKDDNNNKNENIGKKRRQRKRSILSEEEVTSDKKK
uniref:C2H2-type domain-containing protein n=1 Tax=Meloidogyne floridensis TaxID=298350 RepID=A0A915PBI9_9BILA